MKKIIITLVVTLIAFGFGANVFAASTINENEQKVLDVFGNGFKVGSQTVALAPDEINTAKIFFMRDDVNFTAADAQAFIDGHNKIAAVMQAEGVVKIPSLSKSGKEKILQYAKDAALAVKSMNLAYTYDNTTKIASVLNRDTSAVLATSDVTNESTIIKQTGSGIGTTYLVAAAVVVAAAGSFIIAKKKNLLATETN